MSVSGCMGASSKIDSATVKRVATLTKTAAAGGGDGDDGGDNDDDHE